MDIDEQVKTMQELIAEAIDECMPLKTFKVREQHKFGLSLKTKAMMKERDQVRKEIKNKPLPYIVGFGLLIYHHYRFSFIKVHT